MLLNGRVTDICTWENIEPTESFDILPKKLSYLAPLSRTRISKTVPCRPQRRSSDRTWPSLRSLHTYRNDPKKHVGTIVSLNKKRPFSLGTTCLLSFFQHPDLKDRGEIMSMTDSEFVIRLHRRLGVSVHVGAKTSRVSPNTIELDSRCSHSFTHGVLLTRGPSMFVFFVLFCSFSRIPRWETGAFLVPAMFGPPLFRICWPCLIPLLTSFVRCFVAPENPRSDSSRSSGGQPMMPCALG